MHSEEEKNKVMWVGSRFEVQCAKSKSGVQVIGFSLGTALAENSLLAYDGRSIKIVVCFFSGLHQGLDWTENEESIFSLVLQNQMSRQAHGHGRLIFQKSLRTNKKCMHFSMTCII